MNEHLKRIIQVSISIALTILIGYLIFRGVPDWAHAWRVMVQGRPGWLLGALGFIMIHMLLRALRWGVLLKKVKAGISYKNLFSLTMIKYAINVVPPRSGEVVASVVLARKEGISSASVIAASLLERVFDVVTVLVLFLFYFFAFGHVYAPNSETGHSIMLSVQAYSFKGLLALGAIFLVLAFLLRRSRWKGFVPQKLHGFILPFLEGFRVLENRSSVIYASLLSAAIWLSITLQIWCLIRAYLVEFPMAGSLLLMALTVVGVSIPTPAGVGGYQFFMNLTLTSFFAQYLSRQDPSSQAAGISNGCYIVSMVPVVLAGLLFLNYEGLSLSRISKIKAETKPGTGDATLFPKATKPIQ